MIMRFACPLLALFAMSLVAASSQVNIELLEGTFKDKTWDLAPGKVMTTYTEQGFGFVAVPGKFSERGLLVDRSNPFVVRATATLTVPKGKQTLLIRARGASRLSIDDKLILETNFLTRSPDGHGKVPPQPKVEPDVRYPSQGQQDKRIAWVSDGKEHTFRFDFFVGLANLRPEVGEPVVAIAAEGKPFTILANGTPFTDEGWDKYSAQAWKLRHDHDAVLRVESSAAEIAYWKIRHEIARREHKNTAVEVPVVGKLPASNDVDRFINQKLETLGIAPGAQTDDDTFIRRVYLDTVGVIPAPHEIAEFRADRSPDRRARLIDRLLADPRWADHWVGYWQDVLAENPGLLKPTLNNTGPFRWWIYEAFRDNMPMDRFASELIGMEGSYLHGAPGGFAVATENDVPMAAKAQVITKAFLGLDLTCSRCHDSPSSRGFKQEQLFTLAAMLKRGDIVLPKTSSVIVSEGARVPNVKITLHVGSKVAPKFQFAAVVPAELPDGIIRHAEDQRERVAALMTSPRNERFSQVLVNRLWKRYLGIGIVDPVDDWSKIKPSHPALLQWLGRELVTHDYDLKHVARLVLNSQAYQRTVTPIPDGVEYDAQAFASPTRRRMSAEQIVDSLFVAAGKEFNCEMLTFDPEGRQTIKQCLNLGVPRRAWNFIDMANERDRPALALPIAQTFVDVMTAYGWRNSRTTSLTDREESPTSLQPMILAHGLSHSRASRLSDDSAFLEMAVSDVQLSEVIEKTFERVLTRKPTEAERGLFIELLDEGFPQRRTGKPAAGKPHRRAGVSWANHLSPEATRLKLEMEKQAQAGDPPSPRLNEDWRKRMEDMVWSLMNSPEFVFVP